MTKNRDAGTLPTLPMVRPNTASLTPHVPQSPLAARSTWTSHRPSLHASRTRSARSCRDIEQPGPRHKEKHATRSQKLLNQHYATEPDSEAGSAK
jgi:hypothetical protein